MDEVKMFDKFKIGVKGRGKSKQSKLVFLSSMISSMPKDDEVIIVDPEDFGGEKKGGSAN